jgi:drug/metabolite transporter (DMT)-like permease
MNVLMAIVFKLISALLFALMSALVRWLGDVAPVGQMVFFRSAFAIVPVVVVYAWRHELVLRTARPFGHLGRGSISICGMSSNFAALTRLPLVEVTAIQFASPLITVALAALILKERVRIYRWSAVVVGFLGVIVMLAPHVDTRLLVGTGASAAALGAIFAIVSAFCNAGTVVQTRRLTQTETTSSIVFYFSLICALAGLATWPFGWHAPNALELAALISLGLLGGLAHIFLTESYRYASASLLAPFDYTAMLWAFILGWVMFDEVPGLSVYVGSVIVTGAGLYVIWRERQLGLTRKREVESPPAQV